MKHTFSKLKITTALQFGERLAGTVHLCVSQGSTAGPRSPSKVTLPPWLEGGCGRWLSSHLGLLVGGLSAPYVASPQG